MNILIFFLVYFTIAALAMFTISYCAKRFNWWEAHEHDNVIASSLFWPIGVPVLFLIYGIRIFYIALDAKTTQLAGKGLGR